MGTSYTQYQGIVARLKAQISDLEKEKRTMRQDIQAELDLKYKEKVSGIRGRMRKQANKRYWDWAKGMRVRVRNLAKEKTIKSVASTLIGRVKMMDGVISYPLINSFARDNNVTQKETAFIILVNLVGKITAKECILYGFRQAEAKKMLEICAELGLLEKFDVPFAKPVYTPSALGTKYFVQFRRYHRNKVKLLVESDGFKRAAKQWSEQSD